MKIPHVIINITGLNGSGCSKSHPRYYAPIYRELWKDKAEAKDIVIEEYRDYVPGDSTRYHEIETVDAEENVVKKIAGPVIYAKLFPNGLRDEINTLMRDEAEKAKKYKLASAVVVEPHPSFIKNGCEPSQAIALQKAGFATVADLSDDFLTIAQVPGIPAALAMDLTAAGIAARNAKVEGPKSLK